MRDMRNTFKLLVRETEEITWKTKAWM